MTLLKTNVEKDIMNGLVPKLYYKKFNSKYHILLTVQSLDGVFSNKFAVDAEFYKRNNKFDTGNSFSAILIIKNFKHPRTRLINTFCDAKSKLAKHNAKRVINNFRYSNYLKDYLAKYTKLLQHNQNLKHQRQNVTKIFNRRQQKFIDKNVNDDFLGADKGYAITSFSSVEHDSSSIGKIEVQDLSYQLCKDGYVKASDLVDDIYDDVAGQLLKGNPSAIKNYALSDASVGCDAYKNKKGQIVSDDSNKLLTKHQILKYAEGNYWNAIMCSTFGFTTSEQIAKDYNYLNYSNQKLGLKGFIYWN